MTIGLSFPEIPDLGCGMDITASGRETFPGLVQVAQEGDWKPGMASRLYGSTNSEEFYLETTPHPV